MKKLNILLILIGILFCVTPIYAQEQEKILKFESNITVNTDTSIDIVENITFNPSSTIPRHGLEWTLPYVYKVSAFKRPTEIKINEVTYYPVSKPSLKVFNKYSRSDENGWITLRIGDPDTYISESYVYIIEYTLKYTAISYFDEHEEIYLNIIGPGWGIPIENAKATLKAPTEIKEVICFAGPDDSKSQNCNLDVQGSTLNVSPKSTLQPYEGYTVAIKQPLGTFEDTTKEQIILVILSNIGILLPIPVGIFLFGFLKKKFKNKDITVIPQYQPEKDMDSLSSSLLMRNIQQSKNVSAVLIEMAIKGYYKIREYEKKKYEFVKSEKDYKSLPQHITTILDGIFAYGDVVPIKKLTNFYMASNKGLSEAKKYLKENDLISGSKEGLKAFFIIASLFVMFILFNTLSLFISNVVIGWWFGLAISVILFFIFALKIDIKTEKGNEKYAHLLGLKMYINTAEKERIKFHNDPKKYTEVFEALLPYAMIFGLEKKWAAQFEDIYTTPPEWYQGDFTTFNTAYFVSSLGSFNSNVGTKVSPPSSSYSSSGGYRSSGWSSGGSGFGGGGSSGGGGGGSGGGGW